MLQPVTEGVPEHAKHMERAAKCDATRKRRRVEAGEQLEARGLAGHRLDEQLACQRREDDALAGIAVCEIDLAMVADMRQARRRDRDPSAATGRPSDR